MHTSLSSILIMKQLTGPLDFICRSLLEKQYPQIEYEQGFSWQYSLDELQTKVAAAQQLQAGLTGYPILADLVHLSSPQPISSLSLYYEQHEVFHGISMAYVAREWYICVIENTIAADDERRLHLFFPSQHHINDKINRLSQDIPHHHFIERVCQTIHCPALKHLIAEALQQPETAFRRLKTRLHPHLNLDCRDLKINQLHQLFKKFNIEADNIWLLTQTRLDFFEASIYPTQLQTIYQLLQSESSNCLTSYQYANHIELCCLKHESELMSQPELERILKHYAHRLREASHLMKPNLAALGDLILKVFDSQHKQRLESLMATPAFTCLPVQHDDIAQDLWQKLNYYCQELEMQHHAEIAALNHRFKVYLRLLQTLDETRHYFLGAIDEGAIAIDFQRKLSSQLHHFQQQMNQALQQLLQQNRPFSDAYQFYVTHFGFKNALEHQVKVWEKDIEQQKPTVERLPHPCINLPEMHVKQYLNYVSYLKQKKQQINRIYQCFVKQSISSPDAPEESFKQLLTKIEQQLQASVEPCERFYVQSQHKKTSPPDEQQMWSYVKQQFSDWQHCLDIYLQNRRDDAQLLDKQHRLYVIHLTRLLLNYQQKISGLKNTIQTICAEWLNFPNGRQQIELMQQELIAKIDGIYLQDLANQQQQLIRANMPWYQRHQHAFLLLTTAANITGLGIYWMGSSIAWVAVPVICALLYHQVQQIQKHEAEHKRMMAEDIPQLTETLLKIAL